MINPDHIPESRAHRRLRLLLEAAGEKRGRAEGETAGLAKALLAVLEARALPVTGADRARIHECTDAAQLDAWLRCAATAASTAEVLCASPAAERPIAASSGAARSGAKAVSKTNGKRRS